MRSESLRSHLGIGVLATAITLLASTATVAAEPQAECADEVVWTDIVGAERLYWEAMKILEQGEEVEKAALLLGRSASLRVLCDPQTFTLLRMSALLYHRVGNLSEASRTMYRAAEVAIRTGRMLAAAHAYLDYAALYRGNAAHRRLPERGQHRHARFGSRGAVSEHSADAKGATGRFLRGRACLQPRPSNAPARIL